MNSALETRMRTTNKVGGMNRRSDYPSTRGQILMLHVRTKTREFSTIMDKSACPLVMYLTSINTSVAT
jgi:hypothetical protein